MGDNPSEFINRQAQETKLPSFLSKLRDSLPTNKKKLVALGFITVAIPLTVVLALTQQDFYKRAAGLPATPATPPTPTDEVSPSPTEPTISPSLTPTETPIPSPTLTPTPTPLPSKLTLSPIADAFVRSTQPNKNFGKTTSLETDTSPNEISYLKFDLGKLSGKTIKKATLKLKVSDASGSTQTLRRAANTGWSETGITYSNRPAFEASIRSFTASQVNSTLNLQMTNAVNLRKGGNITVGLTSIGDDSAGYYSREAASSNRPQLIVEYQ